MLNEIVQSWSAALNEMSGGNQMIAGAISLWLMGTVTFLARDIPRKILGLLRRYLTTSMTMNNGGWMQEQTMGNFMAWAQPKMRESLSRTLSVQNYRNRNGDEDATLGLGYGVHFFWYGRRLYWITKTELESSGSERQKDRITISTLGRSHKPFRDMLQDFTPTADESSVRLYHLNFEGYWDVYSTPPKRPLETVAASPGLKKQLVDQIRHFKQNREWFYSRGLPYKLSYLLHGQPGTGKTSLIKALASEFGMNICVININSVSDQSLERGLAQAPKNSVIIIEDFDSSGASKNRNQPRKGGSGLDDMFTQQLTLTGLLNTLDGVNPLDDVVLFMTTNHVGAIDPALYRKGRVDHMVEIGEVSPADIRTYAQRLYPEYDFTDVTFRSAVGCQLNEALLYAKDNPSDFVDCLKQSGCVEPEGQKQPREAA